MIARRVYLLNQDCFLVFSDFGRIIGSEPFWMSRFPIFALNYFCIGTLIIIATKIYLAIDTFETFKCQNNSFSNVSFASNLKGRKISFLRLFKFMQQLFYFSIFTQFCVFWLLTKLLVKHVGSVAVWLKALFSQLPGSKGLWFNPHPRHVVASLDKMLNDVYLC